MPKLDALFFDLDDTLCGYWDASKAAMHEVFSTLNPDGISADQLKTAWADAFRKYAPTLKETHWYAIYLKTGEPTRTEQMRLMLLELGIENPQLARQMGDKYAELRDRNLSLFEESLEVIEAVRERFPLGLITNGPADIQRQEIATLGLEGFFNPVMIEGELGFGKPDARVYQIAMERIGVSDPARILMVGNSYGHDIRGAMNAGWAAAWIRRPSDASPSSGKPESKPADGPEPTYEITNLRELLPILE